LLLFDFFNLYFYIIILRQLLLYARVCVYCLVNLICSFFFLHHHLLLLFFYYISHSTDSSGMCIFFSLLCECSFLVNRLSSKRKKKTRRRRIQYVLIFFCLWVFLFARSISLFCLVYQNFDKTEQVRLIGQLKDNDRFV
jgi:hypothetical protein